MHGLSSTQTHAVVITAIAPSTPAGASQRTFCGAHTQEHLHGVILHSLLPAKCTHSLLSHPFGPCKHASEAQLSLRRRSRRLCGAAHPAAPFWRHLAYHQQNAPTHCYHIHSMPAGAPQRRSWRCGGVQGDCAARGQVGQGGRQALCGAQACVGRASMRTSGRMEESKNPACRRRVMKGLDGRETPTCRRRVMKAVVAEEMRARVSACTPRRGLQGLSIESFNPPGGHPKDGTWRDVRGQALLSIMCCFCAVSERHCASPQLPLGCLGVAAT